MMHDLTVILGPTASGKTRYAVKLAAEIGGEIISADSRQVYRGMDIGTGKDIEEYTFNGVTIPYHLINIADAGVKYNLFQYCRDFARVYEGIRLRGRHPILCGGTGLYIDAVTRGYSLPEVPPDPALREELQGLSMEVLVERLSQLKRVHNTTDFDSKKRVIRAIEIAMHEQKQGYEGQGSGDGVRVLNCKFIGISVDRDERNRRIDVRLGHRLESGMIDEVRGLLDSGISPEDLIYYGLEYKFVTQYIIGQLSYSEMESRLAIAIHQFAKRQMTWFRGMERRGIDIEWIMV